MAENSKIEWTTHTFNPWWGCTKVSAACDNCYAETLATRFDTAWGKDAARKFFSDKHWSEPLKWQRKAERGSTEEERHPRVFCASMADVFEDNDTLIAERERLWRLIEATPNLIWLLLTKRPHLMTRFAPADWAGGWPPNIWAMTTVEDQTWADARIPWLMKVPAVVRGLSMEPLFGGVTLPKDFLALGSKAWIITGGESDDGARPADPAWYRTLRDQAVRSDVPFLFKQWGEWIPADNTGTEAISVGILKIEKAHYDGFFALPSAKDHVCIVPHDGGGNQYCWRVGKHAAGRLLDGRTWDQMPVGVMPVPAEGQLR